MSEGESGLGEAEPLRHNIVKRPKTKELLSKQAVQTKEILSKQAVKIAKQAEEHESSFNKVDFQF